MSRPGAWKKGQSGNPNGRPPKSRALTAILERASAKTVEINGRRVASRRLVAALLWEAAACGRVTLPSGEELIFTPKDWLETIRFLYTQIDGPPKQGLDLTSDGKPLTITVEWNDGGTDNG